jgi:hypothetical protein
MSVYTEDFVETDGTDLPVIAGASWATATNAESCQTWANSCVDTSGARCSNYWNVAVTAAQYAQCVIHTAQEARGGPCIRMQSGADSYFYAEFNPTTGNVNAQEVIASAGTDWDAGFAVADGDIIRLESDATTSTTIYLKKYSSGAWSTLATYTGKNAISGGYVGIAVDGDTAESGVTAWEGGDLSAQQGSITLMGQAVM